MECAQTQVNGAAGQGLQAHEEEPGSQGDVCLPPAVTSTAQAGTSPSTCESTGGHDASAPADPGGTARERGTSAYKQGEYQAAIDVRTFCSRALATMGCTPVCS